LTPTKKVGGGLGCACCWPGRVCHNCVGRRGGPSRTLPASPWNPAWRVCLEDRQKKDRGFGDDVSCNARKKNGSRSSATPRGPEQWSGQPGRALGLRTGKRPRTTRRPAWPPGLGLPERKQYESQLRRARRLPGGGVAAYRRSPDPRLARRRSPECWHWCPNISRTRNLQPKETVSLPPPRLPERCSAWPSLGPNLPAIAHSELQQPAVSIIPSIGGFARPVAGPKCPRRPPSPRSWPNQNRRSGPVQRRRRPDQASAWPRARQRVAKRPGRMTWTRSSSPLTTRCLRRTNR